jgi:YVTN family beta-propeller protein
VLDGLLALAAEVLRPAMGAIFVSDPDRARLQLIASSGMDAAAAAQLAGQVTDPANPFAVAAKAIKSFKVGRRPRSIAFLPDSSKAYIPAENDGTVLLVDSVAHRVIRPIELGEPGVVKPMAVLLNGDASKLYVSTGRGHKVFVIDTATNEPAASFEVGQRPWGIALSPDGKMLFTANGPSMTFR